MLFYKNYIVYKYAYSMVVMDIYQYAKFRFSTLSGYWSKLKDNNNKMKNCENELLLF